MSALTRRPGLFERITETIPPIDLPESALRQTVSWSSARNGPISLGDFISANAPKAAHSLGLGPASIEPVPEVKHLSEDELRSVVFTRLSEGTGSTRLGVLGRGVFSTEDIVAEIQAGTDLGHRLLEAEKRNINLLERLAESGKIRLQSEAPIEIPDFDF